MGENKIEKGRGKKGDKLVTVWLDHWKHGRSAGLGKSEKMSLVRGYEMPLDDKQGITGQRGLEQNPPSLAISQKGVWCLQ